MKKLLLLLLVAAGTVSAATFNLFTPATGVLKGSSTTYVTTAATSLDIKTLWSGTCDSTTYLRGDGSCQTPPGTGGGTVNSVALSAPSVFGVSGSPVTTTGTLTLSFATGQTSNSILATPDGTTGALSLRTIVNGDLPTVNTAHGGTGVTTITGPVKGNGTSAFSAAAAADIYGLWSGTCNSSSFLRGDGACASPGTGTVTSVALTVPSGFSVTGSPITTSGTLAISGTLNPAAGGTGVATLSGIAKGNGTSAFTTAASGDVTSLWGGTCDATTYLRGDGSCITPPTGGSGANPSASVGLTAVNGSAGTFLRSDGAPALSQAIVPTWTGVHTFTSAGTAINVTNDVTAGTFTGNGAALTSLNAGNISTGTLAAARGGTGVSNSNTITLGGNISTAAAFTTSGANSLTLTTTGATNVTLPTSGTLSTATGANPSASAGLTAVNGSASTFMRSDGAPAISQSISPTWTGNHTFTPSSGTAISVNGVSGSSTIVSKLSASGAATSGILLANNNNTAGTATDVEFNNHSSLGLVTGRIRNEVTGASNYSMRFYTYGAALSDRMGISGPGNVYINPPESGTTLTVDTSATGVSAAGLNIVNTTGGSSDYANLFVNSGSGSWLVGASPTQFRILRSGSGTNVMQSDTSDHVFFPSSSTSASTQTGFWCYDGSAQLIRDSVSCIVSARRFKERIKPLEAGLSEVVKLKPVRFHYTRKFNGFLQSDPNYSGEQVGFIADDVLALDPRLAIVEKDGTTPHGVRYENMVALLAKAIQEQQVQIEKLRAELHKQKRH